MSSIHRAFPLLACLGLALVSLACGKKVPAEKEAPVQLVATETAVSTSDAAVPSKVLAKPKAPLPPKVEVAGPLTMLAQESIWAPENEAPEVSPAYFYFKPKLGAELSVLPLCDRPAFRVQIVEIVEQDLDLVVQWETHFSSIPALPEKAAATDGDECEVVLLYPAQKTATILDHTKLKKKQLPKRITAAHVQAAVDTNDDGKPDVLQVQYCSENRKQVECYEATATALYRRERKRWRLIHTWEPIT